MRHIIFFIILIFAGFAKAQEPLIAGQPVELSGEATGRENMESALACFTWVNKHGGVNGRPIRLKTYGAILRRALAEGDFQRHPSRRKIGCLSLTKPAPCTEPS